MFDDNYPPGHPTGVSRGDETLVFECEPCYRIIVPEESLKLRLELKHGRPPTCPKCHKVIQRALCDKCEKPATHIDEDRAVNFHLPYCDEHGMRW